MKPNHFKHFAAPENLIAIDAGSGERFSQLKESHPTLELFQWESDKPDAANFDALIEYAVGVGRNRILVAGCSVERSCLVISLLALGRGFDVYLCSDLLDGPEIERDLLQDRLRQNGAMIVTLKQMTAELSAAKDSQQSE